MSVIIQLRRDTAANWTSEDPVLSSGEVGYETDTDKFKIGNGSTAWTSLSYYAPDALAASVFVSPTGLGFQNVVILANTGSGTFSVPNQLQYKEAKFKVTLVGGGAGGIDTPGAAAGEVGGGGGSGGVVIDILTYSAPTMEYTVGLRGLANSNGLATSITYGGLTITADGGIAGGTGGTASGGKLNLIGGQGQAGGTMVANNNYQGSGGDTPLRLGFGGEMPQAVGGADGNPGTGYGAGGSGGRNGTAAAVRAGGVGTSGVIIIEY